MKRCLLPLLALLAFAARAEDNPVSDPALRDELIAMMEVDQAPRDPAKIDVARMKEIDARNLHRLKEILQAHGWPTISMVGHKGAQAAWLLAQHADEDPDLQSLVLREMGRWLDKGEVHRTDYGYLVDRVAVNHDQPQTYGTQGRCVATGGWAPKPIAHEAEVDARRKAMDMQPLAEYIAGASDFLCKQYTLPKTE